MGQIETRDLKTSKALAFSFKETTRKKGSKKKRNHHHEW
jgi:hypothetical protein